MMKYSKCTNNIQCPVNYCNYFRHSRRVTWQPQRTAFRKAVISVELLILFITFFGMGCGKREKMPVPSSATVKTSTPETHKPIPNKFKNNGDETMSDTKTGLIWTKNANLIGHVSWKQSKDFVESMNSGSGTYGHKDWRLPSDKEFESLVNDMPKPAELLKKQGFINVQPSLYWTSTTTTAQFGGCSLRAVRINMANNGIDLGCRVTVGNPEIWSVTDESYVWPVRAKRSNWVIRLFRAL